jgi:hypothetical protein
VGKVLDFLGRDYIEDRIEFYKEGSQTSLEILNDRRRKDSLITWYNRTDELMQLAALQFAKGIGASRVRGQYLRAAVEWERLIDTTAPSGLPAVGELNLHGFLAKGILAAAISGDRRLCKRLAAKFPRPAELYPGPYAILWRLLADDETGAAKLAKRARLRSYRADFPPARIELALGLVHRDPKLLLAGLKAIKTRFDGRWDKKKWLARHKRRAAEKALPSEDSPDELLNSAKSVLTSLDWVLSHYGIAMMNVARWRGITEQFEHTELFTDWVPHSLCQ